jgi:hypothetical protein
VQQRQRLADERIAQSGEPARLLSLARTLSPPARLPSVSATAARMSASSGPAAPDFPPALIVGGRFSSSGLKDCALQARKPQTRRADTAPSP